MCAYEDEQVVWRECAARYEGWWAGILGVKGEGDHFYTDPGLKEAWLHGYDNGAAARERFMNREVRAW